MFLSSRYAILMSPNKGSSVWCTNQSVALPSLLDDWGGGDYWLPSIGLRSPSLLRHQYWCGKLVWRKNPVIICLSMSIMLWIFLTHCFAIVFDNCVIWSDYVIVWAVSEQHSIRVFFLEVINQRFWFTRWHSDGSLVNQTFGFVTSRRKHLDATQPDKHLQQHSLVTIGK